MLSATFVSPTTLRLTSLFPSATPASRCRLIPLQCLHPRSSPAMLQSPGSDGPPNLGDLSFSQQLSSAMSDIPPVHFASSRATLDDATADPAPSCHQCVARALDTLPSVEPVLVAHLTITPDLAPDPILSAISAALPTDAALIGRSVAKLNTERTIELLLLSGGRAIATATATSSDTLIAAQSVGRELKQSLKDSPPIFAIFAATGAASNNDDAIRKALGRGLESECPAYGGQATDGVDLSDLSASSPAWALLISKSVVDADSDAVAHGSSATVTAAAFCGQISFLTSAVVKSWAQPVYVHKLPYLTPSYIGGDGVDDLLTAIKFDDWDTFIDCIENKRVSVNVIWTAKSNQSPLLAVAGRGRYNMMKYLLENGADVHYKNAGDFNAVMYTRAVWKDSNPEYMFKQLELLEQYGANVDDMPSK